MKGENLSNKELVLPQILSLNIKNMTTFPQELNVSFKKVSGRADESRRS
jgi:hypothetical protein